MWKSGHNRHKICDFILLNWWKAWKRHSQYFSVFKIYVFTITLKLVYLEIRIHVIVQTFFTWLNRSYSQSAMFNNVTRWHHRSQCSSRRDHQTLEVFWCWEGEERNSKQAGQRSIKIWQTRQAGKHSMIFFAIFLNYGRVLNNRIFVHVQN